MTYCNLVMWFYIYSIIGWCYETTFCSFQAGHFVNRGFLFGPYLPIYGFGALLVIAVLHKKKNVTYLFFASLIVTTALEYIVSWLLEIIFHRRWWNYSNYTLQINGRVCLLASILFGVLGFILIRYLHPWIKKHTSRIAPNIRIIIAIVLTSIGVYDFTISLIHHFSA